MTVFSISNVHHTPLLPYVCLSVYEKRPGYRFDVLGYRSTALNDDRISEEAEIASFPAVTTSPTRSPRFSGRTRLSEAGPLQLHWPCDECTVAPDGKPAESNRWMLRLDTERTASTLSPRWAASTAVNRYRPSVGAVKMPGEVRAESCFIRFKCINIYI